MVQRTDADKKLVIHIDCFDNVLTQDKYVAWIEGSEYRGMVVAASTISECIKELGISLNVLEMYRKNFKKENR